MIAGFRFAFERPFGSDSALSGLRKPFVNPSRSCRSLGHRLGDVRRAVQRHGQRHVQHSMPLRALTLGFALASVFAANLTATPAHAGASILVEADTGKALGEGSASYPW